MESVFYGFENENFMKTKEEILKETTKRTLNINEGSPLHDAVMKAMEEYAQQQVKNCFIPAVVGRSEQLVCEHKYQDNVCDWRGVRKCIICGQMEKAN